MNSDYTRKDSCEICGSMGYYLYRNLNDTTFETKNTGSIYRCSNLNCSTLWANPFPKINKISSFYDKYYTHIYKCTKIKKSPDEKYIKQNLYSYFKLLLYKVSGNSARFKPELRYLRDRSPGHLLDVGCGNGSFLLEAAHHGWTVSGQEFDAKAAETARHVSGADVRVGDLLDVRYDGASFDAITLSNVLEHLPNPREVLQEAFRLLKPNGTLVSISPNPNSYLHHKYERHWRGLEVPRHLFLLPPAALKTLCQELGYCRIETFSTPGAFGTMESASAEIRLKDAPELSSVRATSSLQLMTIYVVAMLGWDLGEWSVVIASKPSGASDRSANWR